MPLPISHFTAVSNGTSITTPQIRSPFLQPIKTPLCKSPKQPHDMPPKFQTPQIRHPSRRSRRTKNQNKKNAPCTKGLLSRASSRRCTCVPACVSDHHAWTGLSTRLDTIETCGPLLESHEAWRDWRQKCQLTHSHMIRKEGRGKSVGDSGGFVGRNDAVGNSVGGRRFTYRLSTP